MSTVVVCDNCGKKNRVPVAAHGVPHCSNCDASLAWIADVGDDDFDDAVAGPLPVLVDLWAEWCGPCRMVSPILEHLAHDFVGRLKLVRVDVDAAPATARRFQVQGIPTLLVMRGANVVARQTGAAGESALRAWLQQAFTDAEDDVQNDARTHEGV